jgi:hypothetical protein
MGRKKKAPTPQGTESPLPPVAERLPRAEPGSVEVHHRATVLEVEDEAQLLELAADSALRGFLLCRLSPTVALVDPGRAEDLAEILQRRGHTPRVVKTSGSS